MSERLSDRWSRWMNRYHARRAGRAGTAGGFTSQPEPRTIGRLARGKQICAGNFLIDGNVTQAPDASIWSLGAGSPDFLDDIHGFVWLDDLAALGDRKARNLAQTWTREWIDLYGSGNGPGWAPHTTGRRLIRWINHAVFLLQGEGAALSTAFHGALGQQTVYQSKRWRAAAPGLPRFEALTGLVYAALALKGMERLVPAAVTALARECETEIQPDGGIRTRNPEDLLEVFTLLTWASDALGHAGREVAPGIRQAIERAAPTLRALRQSDGGLARFHGGERGLEGRLDTALHASGIKGRARDGLAMGFLRLQAARTSIVIDCAVPPDGPASARAHASTLAFEMTSGRRPLIVSCGDGRQYGPAWARAARATASHSTLALDGYSSSRLGPPAKRHDPGAEWLFDQPKSVRLQIGTKTTRNGLVAGHDGYLPSHGLTHVRQLELSDDGRAVAGEDVLAAIEIEDQDRFDRAMDRTRLQGFAFHVRFHLHPDVDATVDMGGTAVSMVLKSGEVWIFRHDGTVEMTLDPSVFLEKGRLRPRATKQIVLSSRAIRYASRVRWTLAKAQDTPTHMRDFEREDRDVTEYY